MLHVPTNLRVRTERALSTVAFALVLATWCAGYAALCPADYHLVRRFALVEVRP